MLDRLYRGVSPQTTEREHCGSSPRWGRRDLCTGGRHRSRTAAGRCRPRSGIELASAHCGVDWTPLAWKSTCRPKAWDDFSFAC
jgi:hypothetical protein